MSTPSRLNTKLLEIQREYLRSTRDESNPSVVTDIADLSSYNWVKNRKIPTIIIPGRPAEWSPPESGQQLRSSTIDPFHDFNCSNYSNHPLEPALAAVFHQNPAFDTTTVDIVGCGSTLTHLLSFALNEDRNFRCNVQRIGKTIFLIRQEDPRKPYGYPSYQRPLMNTFTTWAPNVAGSESHQRIIAYRFGGLRLMVRYERDAFLPSARPKSRFEEGKRDSVTKRKFDDFKKEEVQEPDHELTDVPMKPDTAITDAIESHLEGSINEFIIESAGLEVSRKAILTIKCRSAKASKFSSAETLKPQLEAMLQSSLPRLWLRQIPNFLVAFHERGFFRNERLHQIDALPAINSWEKDNSGRLRMFNNLLRELIRLSENHPRLEVCRFGNGPIEVWSTPGNWSVLSQAMTQRLEQGVSDAASIADDKDVTIKKIKVEDEPDILKILYNSIRDEESLEPPGQTRTVSKDRSFLGNGT